MLQIPHAVTLMLQIPHAVTIAKRMRGNRLSSLVDGFLVSSLFLMTECGRRMWAPESKVIIYLRGC